MEISRPFLNQFWKIKSGFLANSSGGSRPSDKGGPGHPDPEIRVGGGGAGDGLKKFFSGLWASVWSKNGGGGGYPGPSATKQCQGFTINE